MHKKVLRFNIRILLLIDLSINILFLLIFIPFFNYGLKYAMKSTKQSYITPSNLTEFLLSPLSILLFILLLLIIPILLLSKINSLIYYCSTEGSQRRPLLFRIIFYGFYKTFLSLKQKNFSLLFFTIPFYLLTLMPFLVGVIVHSSLSRLAGTDKEILLKFLLILLFCYLSLLFTHSIFTLHFKMTMDISLRESYLSSKAFVKEHAKKLCKIFCLMNLLLILLYFLFYYLLLALTAVAVYFFSTKSLAISVFLTVYPKINFYAMFCFSMFASIINFNLLTSFYQTYQMEGQSEDLGGYLQVNKKMYHFQKKHHILVNVIIICLLITAGLNFYTIIRNNSLYISEAFNGIQISSHRGNSYVSPENTLPALESAIQANSDYAEIDVQQTKDGVLVLLHDKTLLRTSGINRYIGDMTIDEVSVLDVGSWFGIEYYNTKIPTLEEVLVYCKGKINLNIEVKSSKKQPNIEEKLVSLIEQYDYINQCVISSSDYKTLVNIKKLNEDIKTGYILSAVYGDFYEKEYVDFFSIRSRFVTQNVIESAHRVGKEVHAWTVNSPKEMERLKSIQIDTIITDNPTLAREVLYRDDNNGSFIQLINRMFRYRSHYSLLDY